MLKRLCIGCTRCVGASMLVTSCIVCAASHQCRPAAAHGVSRHNGDCSISSAACGVQVAGFDEAAAAGDLGGMAKCARIMAEFRRGEAQLVQVR